MFCELSILITDEAHLGFHDLMFKLQLLKWMICLYHAFLFILYIKGKE